SSRRRKKFRRLSRGLNSLKTYKDALSYLDWLCVFGVKEGLKRIKALAEALGNPQNAYRTIHVAGTNGKGSVCAILAEMLKAQGLTVGLFTSPHLESYCERIKVNGVDIPEDDFAEMIFRVKTCNVEATHFEVLTAAAFLYFKVRAVDVAVIEVGLGGMLDSTNIITPELSIITNIALDHENILGDLEGIARNKAGIIKPNVPTVTGAQGKPLEIIRAVAKEKNSALHEVTAPANVKINLRGEYQKMNAAIAIKAAQVLGIDGAAIEAGLARVQWAGRFEVVDTAAGVVVIDGAHNPNGAAALRHSLDKTFPNGRRAWLFGALRDKDFDSMIKILFRADDLVIVTPPDSERAASTDTLCKCLHERGIKCLAIENNVAAVERLMKTSSDVKIIAGSLYLIGAVRRFVV
ncbi:MAG: bifunctional folylpolyglutamate synthase/dihydrofolate synthase, partial [Selenomonadaceae bacterium]|nr:bifunctional folylpolyglutamate synthase/dihydrofolate synthase [Selenomonadaceae bacterium]